MESTDTVPFDYIPYGVQYYRAPTPTPSEWEDDLKLAAENHIPVIQLRPQWRWHERRKGEFYFDDMDRLFDLTEQYGLKVIVKFLMECAPQWLYREYDCYRIDNTGRVIPGGANAAFYVGGWIPCFDHPKVREEGTRFIEATVQRYRDRANLIAWNAWNEPRARPVGECCCKHSAKSYEQWLQRQWGTIDAWNEFTGKAWGAWEEVEPPRLCASDTHLMGSDYTEIYFWKKWAMWAAADRVQWVHHAVKANDTTRPCYAHVGGSTVIQNVLADGSDDVETAKLVDYYGCSLVTPPLTRAYADKPDYERGIYHTGMECDWLRCASPYFWVNEIYTGIGNWPAEQLTPQDITFRAMLCLAHGAKGLVYWQFKEERLGLESTDCGLVHLNGKPTERLAAAAEVGAFLEQWGRDLSEAHVPIGDVALMYDHSSDLISAIEDCYIRHFDYTGHIEYPYKVNLRGLYLHLWTAGLAVDYLDSRYLDGISRHKVVLVPYCTIMADDVQRALIDYVAGGGTLVCGPAPGARQANTWVSVDVPPPALQELFGCRQTGRVYWQDGRHVDLATADAFDAVGNVSEYGELTADAQVLATWPNETAAIVEHPYGNGRAILLGLCSGLQPFSFLQGFLTDTLDLHSPWTAAGRQGEVRRLTHPAGDFIFIANPDAAPNEFRLTCPADSTPTKIWGPGDLKVENDQFIATLPARSILVARTRR